MHILSREEIIEILSESKDPHLRTTLKLINKGIDIATALLVGAVSLVVEREKILRKTNNDWFLQETPNTHDLS